MEVIWAIGGRMGSMRDRIRGIEDIYVVQCEYVNQVESEWRYYEGEGEWLEVNEG